MLQISRRLLIGRSVAPGACPDRWTRQSAQKKYDEGASDTEIKIGNTNPYSGNASAYGTIGKTIEAYFKMVNDTGGINGRKINFITYDDGYAPPKTARNGAQAGRGRQGAVRLPDARHAIQHGHPEVPERGQESAAAVRGHRRLEVGQAQGATRGPWACSRTTSPKATIYAKHILANVKDPKIAVLMQNDDYGKDYFNGFKQGLGKDADKIVQVATYEVADPTVDSQIIAAQELGRQRVLQHHHPEVRGAGHQEGWRARLEAGALSQQRVDLGRRR